MELAVRFASTLAQFVRSVDTSRAVGIIVFHNTEFANQYTVMYKTVKSSEEGLARDEMRFFAAAQEGQGPMEDLPKDPGFWADVLRRIRKRTRYSADAEDLLHMAFLRLNSYRAEHPVDNPVSFLVQTAANISVDQYRRERFTNPNPLEDYAQILQDNAPLQDEVLAVRERLQRVREGIAKLTPRTRQVFLMHRIEEMKHKDIARQLGISQGAVEKHIAKAVLFLTEWTQGW